jgi:cell division initiation protein
MLTPMDIRDKTFNVKMRGYDQDQVNDFLDQIIADYESVLKQKDEMATELKAAKDQVAHYEGMKDAMNQSIIVAQEAADRVRSAAEAEAAEVRQQAQDDAEGLLNDAHAKSEDVMTQADDRSRQLALQTEDLRQNAKQFRDHLVLLLQAELETVKGAEWSAAVDHEPFQPVQTADSDADAENADEDAKTLDTDGVDSVNSGAEGVADDDTTSPATDANDDYTEIVFPDDPIAKD